MGTNIVRVGLVGFGKMGVLHSALLKVIPEAKLVGIVDSDVRLRRVVESIGLKAPFYTSLERFIEDQRPDAVLACVPPFANPHVARLCASHRIHVFVEKPLANSLPNAANMLKVAEQTDGLRHAVGFMLRHRQLWRKAKKVSDSGALGGVRFVNGSAYQGSVFKDIRGWPARMDLAGGGAFASIGSHLLDAVTWLCGEVAEVSAQVTHTTNLDVEDRGEAGLTFRSGAEGQLAVAWDVPGRLALELRVAMRGPNGELEVGDQQLHLRLNRPHGEWPAGLTKIHASDLPTSDAFFLGGEGYYAQDADFVRAILHGSSPTVTWVDGYRVQVVLDAIYRSAAADGKRFSLIDT